MTNETMTNETTTNESISSPRLRLTMGPVSGVLAREVTEWERKSKI
jgi:hypothetical protein